MAKRKKLSITPEEKLLIALFGKSPGARRKQGTSPSKTRAASLQRALKQKIDDVLRTLSREDQEVIKLRYGLGDGYSRTV